MKKIFIIFITVIAVFGQETEGQFFGIREKLGETIDIDKEFTNEDGNKTTFRELMDGKPAVLSLVYYKCPGICAPLLNDLREVVERSDVEPGDDYEILTLSFSHSETSDLAKKKKKNYLDGMKRQIDENAWHWLVGTKDNIKYVTDAVGFDFKKQKFQGLENQDDFLHAGALIFLSPDGKITRYIMFDGDNEFLPFNFKMSIYKATEGKAETTIKKIVKLCFKYDPESNNYVADIKFIIGVLMTLGIIVFIAWSVMWNKKNRVVHNE